MQAKFPGTSISQLATEGTTLYSQQIWIQMMKFFFACLLTLGSGCYAYVNAAEAQDNFV